MKISEFFDVNNIEHLKAFDILQKTGCWPKNFIPKDGDPIPELGSKLTYDFDDDDPYFKHEENMTWFGENGTEMIIETEIANFERQNGDTFCQFIAGAHAHLIGRENLMNA